MTKREIHQALDANRLEVLSDEARENADEAGELDGNQHYVDLSAATWDDVAYALEAKARLIRQLETSADPSGEEQRLYDTRGLDNEREALWHLDVGVAAAVVALNALGAHTALSCNGGAFGSAHQRHQPTITFYPQDVPVERLLELARDSDVGLTDEQGRGALYPRTVQEFLRFAALAFGRYGQPNS